MPIQSDLTIHSKLLDPALISEQTKKFNDRLIELGRDGPKWWEVGAAKYRQMRWNGETAFPAPVVLESGKNIKLPSRESGRQIPCRVFEPEGQPSKGVYYHIHGGGWVLQSELGQDVMLKYLADNTGLTVVSVGYRLAPEHPYPAGHEDCVDVAEYLIDNGERDYGGPLLFMTGDSAGGHLTAVTCYILLQSRPKFNFKGLVLNYGAFDISGFLPHVRHWDLPLILDGEIMNKYVEAYLPNTTQSDRRDPLISPLFADMYKLKLPPALFVCGTLDVLLDDSVMMCTKWAMSGAESCLKLYPGAPHGFSIFPMGGTEHTEQALKNTTQWVREHM